MQQIPNGDVGWIMEYILVRAKQVLGRVRGKFHGIPNSEGATDDTDYSELLSEGIERQRELEEELRKRRRPLEPVIE
jgi:hypothetical protein